MEQPALTRIGHLLIDDETICVSYAVDGRITTLQKRPCGVLGHYLKRESQLLKRERTAALTALRNGKVIQL